MASWFIAYLDTQPATVTFRGVVKTPPVGSELKQAPVSTDLKVPPVVLRSEQ